MRLPQRPNFVYVLCDDLGWGDVSCLNPDSRIHTPSIDALRNDGMCFTDAHAGAAVCTPSRYGLLTGRYCWRTALKDGVGGGYSPPLISSQRLTVAQMLRQAGYVTACIGKSMVVFTSDNGPETLTRRYRELYGHSSTWRFRGLKRDNWEGGHRVPFIVSWPGWVTRGATCDHSVELVDFMATAADIVGRQLPADAAEDSRSIRRLIEGGDAPEVRPFGIHHSCNGHWAVRRGRWKLLLHAGSGGNPNDSPEDSGPVQLYDMQEDPFESRNLHAQCPDLVVDLRELCLDAIQRGRSTPGPDAANDPTGRWTQLEALLGLRDRG